MPYRHTIVYCVAKVDSLYNNVLRRTSKLSIIAMNSMSQVVHDVFSQSSALIYSSLGYIMPSMVIATRRSTHSKIASVRTSSVMSELLLILTHTYLMTFISFVQLNYSRSIYLLIQFSIISILTAAPICGVFFKSIITSIKNNCLN